MNENFYPRQNRAGTVIVWFFFRVSAGLIFSVQEKTEVTMTCPHNEVLPQKTTIEKSGIILIPDGCQITTPNGLSYYGNAFLGLSSPNSAEPMGIHNTPETNFFDLILDQLNGAADSMQWLVFISTHGPTILIFLGILCFLPFAVCFIYKLFTYMDLREKFNMCIGSIKQKFRVSTTCDDDQLSDCS